MRTCDVKELIRQRFSGQSSAVFFEVADATGFNGTGWADAISMSLWPSHGLELQGFEIKVSRGDWKRELANPLKAEKFAQRCDRWWLVTADGVVDDENEIPANWGWMLALPDGLHIKRKAEKNATPLPLDRSFLAALLRSAGKVDQMEVEAICKKRVAELREHDERNIKWEVERAAGRKSDDSRIMDLVRAALGEEANCITIQSMADSIVAVYKSGIAETWRGLKTVVELLENTSAKLRSCSTEMNLPKIEKRKRNAKVI